MLTHGFWKFYGSITEALEAPKTIFQQNMEDLDKFTPPLLNTLPFIYTYPILLNTLMFRVFDRNISKLYELCNDACFSFRNVVKLYELRKNAFFDFRNVAELYGLSNNACF